MSVGVVRARPVRARRARPRGVPATSGAAARTRCPRCGEAVLRTPVGELLELVTHPLAVSLPEGGTLTIREAAEIATGRAPARGHHVHIERAGYGCHPAAQLVLFTA